MKKKSFANIAEGLHKGRAKYMKMLDSDDRYAKGSGMAMVDRYDSLLDELVMEQETMRESKGGIEGKMPTEMFGNGGMMKYQGGGPLDILPFWGKNTGSHVFNTLRTSFPLLNAVSTPYQILRTELFKGNEESGSFNDFEGDGGTMPFISNEQKDNITVPFLYDEGQTALPQLPSFSGLSKLTDMAEGFGKVIPAFLLPRMGGSKGTFNPFNDDRTMPFVSPTMGGSKDSASQQASVAPSNRTSTPFESFAPIPKSVSGGTPRLENAIPDDLPFKDVPEYPEKQKRDLSGMAGGLDAVSSVLGTITPFIENIFNYAQNRKAQKDKLPTPIYNTYAARNPNIDVGSQVENVLSSESRFNQSIDRSMSGPAAVAAKMAGRASSMQNIGGIREQERNYERSIMDDNAMGFNDVRNQNAGLHYDWLMNEFARRNAIRSNDSQNIANASAKMMQIRQDNMLRDLDLQKMDIIMRAFDDGIISRNLFDMLSKDQQRALTARGVKIQG